VNVAPDSAEAFAAFLARVGFGIPGGCGGEAQRWVTHLDVDSAAVDRAIAAAERFFEHARY
jgi:threonine aldolase